MYNKGIRRKETISQTIIEKAKKLLTSKSQHQTASELGISQYSVWCIANRKYDSKEPLQERHQNYFSHF
jgi:hypothetical protein